MSSRLMYFGNVISRTKHLTDIGLLKEPAWLEPCLRFPPLTEPVKPALPDRENLPDNMTHRKGPFFLSDGHRFDPKKPTQMPRDKQSTDPEQPYHIFFTKDTYRKQYFTEHPDTVVYLGASPRQQSKCEHWIKTGENQKGRFVVRIHEHGDRKSPLAEFKTADDCDISDLLEKVS